MSHRAAWIALTIALAVLLAAFHVGFFLYAVIVVLGVGAASWAFVAAVARDVVVTRSVDRGQLEIGEATAVAMTVRNAKRLPAPWLFWEEGVHPDLSSTGATSGMANLGRNAQRIYRI